jgi:hypothetical protein
VDGEDSPTTQAYLDWVAAISTRRRVRGTFASMTQARPDFGKQEQAARERAEQVNSINRVQDPKRRIRV